MPIKYDKLFAMLEGNGHSMTYWLRQNGFHSATVTKLRKNERINTDTIERLCSLLNCQPGDIMEYVIDGEVLTMDSSGELKDSDGFTVLVPKEKMNE